VACSPGDAVDRPDATNTRHAIPAGTRRHPVFLRDGPVASAQDSRFCAAPNVPGELPRRVATILRGCLRFGGMSGVWPVRILLAGNAAQNR